MEINPWGLPKPPLCPGGALLPAQLLARLSGWERAVVLVGSSNRLWATHVGAER